MADFADKASEREGNFQAESLFAQRLRAARPTESAYVCADCEAEIPEARRRASRGCSLCIDCQELNDNKRKRAL